MNEKFPRWLKITGRITKWMGLALAAMLVAAVALVLVVRLINTFKTKITTPNGIQENVYMEVGGIKQHLQIRGEDTANPIIVILHGGPGSPMAHINYTFQPPLEADYTLVSWDQRGCGKTFFANPNLDLKANLSTELLLSDLDAVVDYLTDRFGQKKVILMGHSWGTILGSRYVKAHPEKVSAYVGVGQIVDFGEGKVLSAQAAAERAAGQGHPEDASLLSSAIQEYSREKTYPEFDLTNYLTLMGLSQKYMTDPGEIPGLETIWLGLTSPDITLPDIRWYLQLNDIAGLFDLEALLMEEMFFTFNLYDQGSQYEVPVYFISGKQDWITPSAMVVEYYASLDAPDKMLLLIDHTGHTPFLDNPQAFDDALKSVLSRLTK